MNAIHKKILLAGLVALFAFVVTIGSTYAWFTAGQTSLIGTISMDVKTDTSLLILLDKGYIYDADHDKALLDNPNSYVSQLSNTDITSYYDFTQIVMAPITTEDGQSMTLRDGITSAAATADENGVYLEFSVWLLSQDIAANVGLKDLSITATSGTALQNNVVNAIRLSLTDVAATPTPIVQIYGLDKDYDFTFLPGQTGYDESVPDNNQINPTVENDLTLLHSVYYLSTGSAVTDESTLVLGSADTVVALTSNVPSKITLRVWIEGWDADCNNNVLTSNFAIGLDFIVIP